MWSFALAALLACSQTAAPPAAAPVAAPVPAPVAEPAPVVEAPPAEAKPAPAAAKLNLNVATADELMTVPGMNKRMVHEFEEYRPYKSVAQFRKEIGKYVDPPTVEGYLGFVYVPVDANGADKATWMQLPGLDDAEADAVVGGRPYADRAAVEAALTGKVDDVAAAMVLVAAP
jgi:DNA uptake protein ComE-like DNA-binding protein